MFRKLWELFAPFRNVFYSFLLLLVLYEGLQILEGYIPSAAIAMYGVTDTRPWLIFFVLIATNDLLHIYLDMKIDWMIIAKIAYPRYKYLKTKTLEQFLHLDLKWHQSNNSGALVGKTNRGVDQISDLMDVIFWEFVPTMIQTILSLIPLLFLSPLTILILAISMSFFMYFSIKSFKVRKPLRTKRHDLYEVEWAKSLESVRAVETVYMFSQRERILDEYGEVHDQIRAIGLEEARNNIFVYGKWRLLSTRLARLVIWGFWAVGLSSGALAIPAVVYLNTLTEKLFHSFWRFSRLFEKATEAHESVDRLVRVLESQTAIPEIGSSFGDINPDIDIEGYSFTYDREDGSGGLKDFCLNIKAGEKIALVGPSGAGKTTVRRVITGLWRSAQGSISVGGHHVDDWNLPDLLKLFSYVPQGDDVFIFDSTVEYNIRFSRPDATMDEVIAASKLAGIHRFIENDLPQGYGTRVGEKGIKLSGGQKQRVALARAILADRPIIILDEATSAVDAITEDEIQNQMRTILKNKTAIIIAHRLSTIWNLADRIVVMDDGSKIEEGTHEELMSQNGLYRQMVELQTYSS
jgi:ATP-binding cassette, subfamily B, heavy metal transporter